MRRPRQLHPEQHGPARPNRYDQRRHPTRSPANLRRELRSHDRGDRAAVLPSPAAQLPLDRGRPGNLHHPADGVRRSLGAVDACQGGVYDFPVHESAACHFAQRGGVSDRFSCHREHTLGLIRAPASDRPDLEMPPFHACRVGASPLCHPSACRVDVQSFSRHAAGQAGASDGQLGTTRFVGRSVFDLGADGVHPLRQSGRRDAAGHVAGGLDRDAELARYGHGLDTCHLRHRGVCGTPVHQSPGRLHRSRSIHAFHPRLQTRSEV